MWKDRQPFRMPPFVVMCVAAWHKGSRDNEGEDDRMFYR